MKIEFPISIRYNKESKDFTVNDDCVKRGETKPINKEKNVVSVSDDSILTIVSHDLTRVIQIEGGKVKRIAFEEESPILEIIEKGESDRVEFKSSLRWDYKEKRANKELVYEVVGSISGFMNTEGGILLIGVSDLKEVLGIEMDYSTLGKGKKNRDGFELQLTEVINNYIGREYRGFIKVAFDELYNKEICYIEITKSPKPVFIKKDGESEFVIRAGNRTQTLDVKEATEYIKMHWEE